MSDKANQGVEILFMGLGANGKTGGVNDRCTIASHGSDANAISKPTVDPFAGAKESDGAHPRRRLVH
jgi:hypothetical protein